MQIPKDAKIYVAGHTGLVGSALVRLLRKEGFKKIITRSHKHLNLTDQRSVLEFFSKKRPDYVFLAAARVGGILANRDFPSDFILDNLRIQSHVFESSLYYGVKKLIFYGSSCIYPKDAPQPLKEEFLLCGPLEETNEAYAVAKIAGIRSCQAIFKQHGVPFISLLPPSLYGIGDNYHLEKCHVVPALIRRFHEAKTKGFPSVTLWGDGKGLRELMFADDLARASLFCLENYEENEPINIGSGIETTIDSLAELIRRRVDYRGEIVWDTLMPGGVKRKLLDSSRIHDLGWKSTTSLSEGIQRAYEDYCSLFEHP